MDVEDDYRKVVEMGTELSFSALVPELNINFVDANIQEDDFKEFLDSLEVTLCMLFDVLHGNEPLFFIPAKENRQFRINLMLIVCEQTCSNKYFRIKKKHLQKNINDLIPNCVYKHLLRKDDFVADMFQIFKTKLKPDTWKNQYSYIFSFWRFCELLVTQHDIDTDKCMIILAIGTNLLESYEPEHKFIGLNLFSILLRHANKATIKELNIHGVIFFTVLPNLDKINDEHIIPCLLDCLFNCASLTNPADFSVWNNIDDLLSGTFRKLNFNSNLNISVILLDFLNRILSIKSPITDGMEYKEIRYNSRRNCSCSNYRWVKSLLAAYQSECQKYLGYANCDKLLRVLHVSYILGVYSVPPELVFQQNKAFYRDFVKLLMLLITHNVGQAKIIQEVKQFIHTFIQHLDEMDPSSGSEYISLKNDLIVLLAYDVFNNKIV